MLDAYNKWWRLTLEDRYIWYISDIIHSVATTYTLYHHKGGIFKNHPIGDIQTSTATLNHPKGHIPALTCSLNNPKHDIQTQACDLNHPKDDIWTQTC